MSKSWVLVLFSSSSSQLSIQCKCSIRTVTSLCCILISASNDCTAERLILILKYLRSFWCAKHHTLWIFFACVFCQVCRFLCMQPLNVTVQNLWGHLTCNSNRCKKETQLHKHSSEGKCPVYCSFPSISRLGDS